MIKNWFNDNRFIFPEQHLRYFFFFIQYKHRNVEVSISKKLIHYAKTIIYIILLSTKRLFTSGSHSLSMVGSENYVLQTQ